MDRPDGRPVEPAERPVLDTLPLANWKATTAAAGTVEIAAGEPWPPGDAIAFERHTVTIPALWPLADVRLELDVGAEGVAILHSRPGIERHPIGATTPRLRAPTRAFGLRIEAHRAASKNDADALRLGTTCLILLASVETGGDRAPGSSASTDGS